MKRIVSMVIMMGCGGLSQGEADMPWQVIPHGFTGLQVTQGEDILLEMNAEVVGPEDATPRLQELPRAVAPGRRVVAETLRAWTPAQGKAKQAALPPVEFHYEAVAPAPDTVELRYRCATQAEAELTGVSLVVPYGDFWRPGGFAFSWPMARRASLFCRCPNAPRWGCRRKA